MKSVESLAARNIAKPTDNKSGGEAKFRSLVWVGERE